MPEYTENIRQQFRLEPSLLQKFLTRDDNVAKLWRMGESRIALKTGVREWGNRKRDNEFVQEFLKDMGIYSKPEIGFNNGKNEAVYDFSSVKGFSSEGTIRIDYKAEYGKTMNIGAFGSRFSKVGAIENHDDYSLICYTVEIPPGTERNDYYDDITVVTDIRTYIYKIHLHCIDGIEYSDEFSFRNMNEFFQLYQTDYEGALKCFTDNTFISWLDRNEYEQEIEFYNQVKGSGQHIALQNFLCLLNFDVNPVLDMEYMKGILTLKNKGTGYLYGRVECSKGVKADISEWDQQKNIVKIRTSKPGFVKVISNGGTLVQQVDAETGNDKPFSVIEKNISILRNRFKIKIDSLKEDPVISVDNNFVYVTYDLQDCAVTARKNIPLIKLIWSRLKKIQLYSNVKLICKGCIIHIRIRIA